MYIYIYMYYIYIYYIYTTKLHNITYIYTCFPRIFHPGRRMTEENAPFGWLRHESGVHRVQRVPVTERKGRMQTSSVAVVLLPVAEEAATWHAKGRKIWEKWWEMMRKYGKQMGTCGNFSCKKWWLVGIEEERWFEQRNMGINCPRLLLPWLSPVAQAVDVGETPSRDYPRRLETHSVDYPQAANMRDGATGDLFGSNHRKFGFKQRQGWFKQWNMTTLDSTMKTQIWAGDLLGSNLQKIGFH